MASSEVQHKLTAILCTDVVGYSRLMGDDPEGTLKTLTEYREAFSSRISEYNGRVVNAPGDSILAEFGSVLEAVQCAVDIQRELAERNTELPDSRRMDFRIGINLGDVLVKDGDIYGDGVNVAARLESLAEPGGICISGKAHEEVKNRLPLHFQSLGKQTVKNIAEPVESYRILSKPGAAAHRVVRAGRTGMAKGRLIGLGFSLLVIAALAGGGAYYTLNTGEPETSSVMGGDLKFPEQPSIAVLPFMNMSDDPKQRYFGDGLAEDIITDLSKYNTLFVISRTSSFRYRGQDIDVRKVSKELGVRYVLEGSLRKSGGRIRVTVQLIDATTGRHVWAERYDRPETDFFDLQDEITDKVVVALEAKLLEGRQTLARRHATESLEAYYNYRRADELWNQHNKEANALGIEAARKAIELDPQYATAYGFLGHLYHQVIMEQYDENPGPWFKKAQEVAKQILKLEQKGFVSQQFLTVNNFFFLGNTDKAIELAKQTLNQYPNDSDAVGTMGLVLISQKNKLNDSISLFRRSIRLEPFPESWKIYLLGFAYHLAGRLEDSIAAYQKTVSLTPTFIYAHVSLTAALYQNGQIEAARVQAAKVLQLNPKYILAPIAKQDIRTYVQQKEKLVLLFDAARKAGIPWE